MSLERVSRDTALLAALEKMPERRGHILAVTGEKGHGVGIVTLEDITGELLGADMEDFR